MPKITVIMPSLNVVKYIDQSIRSVREQSFEDIEILVIDAGSTDGTLEIIKEHSLMDSRIRVIMSDRKSYGYQVNLGIREAKGEFVGVVETDDFIEPCMYEKLYTAISNTQFDYVKCCGFFAFEVLDGAFLRKKIVNLPKTKVYGEAFSPKVTPELENTDRFLWTGLYRKTFLKNIKLNESNGAAFQDVGFNFQVYTQAQSALYIEDALYHYRVGLKDASSSNHNAFRFFMDEYHYISPKIDEMPREWKEQIFLRMLGQFLTKFRVMAESGEFWKDQVEDIEAYRKVLLKSFDNQDINPNNLDDDSLAKIKVLEKSAEALYGVFLYTLSINRNRCCNRLKRFGDNKIVLFGIGKNSLFPHALLKHYRVGNVVAYCDNSSDGWGKELRGVPVLPPIDAYSKYEDALFVITSQKYCEEMRANLISIGVVPQHIVLFDIPEDMDLFR